MFSIDRYSAQYGQNKGRRVQRDCTNCFLDGLVVLCSLVTLFSNKYILTYMGGNVQVLGVIQMVTTATLGALKVYGPSILRGNKKVEASNSKPVRPPPPHKSHSFWKTCFTLAL